MVVRTSFLGLLGVVLLAGIACGAGGDASPSEDSVPGSTAGDATALTPSPPPSPGATALVEGDIEIESGQPYTDFHRIDDADHRVSVEVPVQWMNLSSPAYNGAVSFQVTSSPNPDTPQGVEPPFFQLGASFFRPEDAVPLSEIEDTGVGVLEAICSEVTEPNRVDIQGYEGNARLATGCQTFNAPEGGTAQLQVVLLPSTAPDHGVYLSLIMGEANQPDLRAAEHALETLRVDGDGLVFPPGF